MLIVRFFKTLNISYPQIKLTQNLIWTATEKNVVTLFLNSLYLNTYAAIVGYLEQLHCLLSDALRNAVKVASANTNLAKEGNQFSE